MPLVGSVPLLSDIFLFGIAAFLFVALAKQKGFFLIVSKRSAFIELKFVLLAFMIYIGVNLLLSPLIMRLSFFNALKKEQVLLTGVASITINFLITLFLLLLCLKLKKDTFKNIWNEEGQSLLYDIKAALFCWLIVFPLIMFLSSSLDYILMTIFKIKELPDQIAIEYVKTAFKHPSYFILAFISITVFAPFIEELLFRGFLQTYLIGRLGSKLAIAFTSVLFALFHYAPEQKLSNITILTSLFVLSCFLGFLYEKQKSLLSPIVLHATFNLISIFNLILFKGN